MTAPKAPSLSGRWNRERIRIFLLDLASPEHLFAGFVGLLVLILLTRALTVKANGRPGIWSPLLSYQDLFLWAGLVWTFYGLFHLARSTYFRSAIAIGGWLLILILTGLRMEYLLVDLAVCHPLTYHMMVLSGVAIQVSLEHQVHAARPMVPMAIACVILTAEAIRLLAPNGGENLYRRFHTLPCLFVVLAYVTVGHLWKIEHLHEGVLAANPEYVLVSSYFEPQIPPVNDAIPSVYLNDFRPPPRPATSSSNAPAVVSPVSLVRQRPLNVVMVVMESIGANRLGLYNPAERTSPELIALARHAMVFQRIYAAEPETSAAMPGLICSVYPSHSVISIPRGMPAIAIPGLAAVLADYGYRTAFIHDGQLIYDKQKDFLRNHGFAEIFDAPRDFAYPRDPEVVPTAVNWIKSNPHQPFFLTIWTQDTHHPYLNTVQDAVQGAPPLERYEEAVKATDLLIGRIADALTRMKLADDTLLVVTGDHGEAFREHDQLIHGLSLYNEEIHIPLMIVNPKLIAHETAINSVGRQIDIGPTLLDLLGYEAPASWQGSSLLEAGQGNRAYLFATGGDFTMGVVEGDFKYIYDFADERRQLYNLATDPDERHDLSSNPARYAMMRRAQLRLEAWLAFQNNYLARFADPVGKRVNVLSTNPSG